MLDQSDYRAQLQALLPQGAAWPRDPEAVWTKLLAGLAAEAARVEARAGDLIEEADPRTAAEMLADWELMAGLPDPCADPPDTLIERRAALVAKVTALGGASRQYFIDLAAALGYAVTITEFDPFVCGAGACGDPLHGEVWRFVWQVNSALFTVTEFKAGQSAAGDPLRDWGNDVLECVVSRVAPAHTLVLFAYS